ncbi:homocysteine S-methyltransferase family protein [bacterium]|nr:homocysteine S-methyltransferase family protein [bacterium]MBU1984133.1 homocysteine S-methyltransferase family protein [bacterium]
MSKTEQTRRPLILDGALGTELERRGFVARLPLWSAWALIEAPDLVKRIHCDYVRAGAEILTAATFRTTRYTLAKETLTSWAEELTHLAIRLAREAIGESESPPGSATPRVAGCIAPLEDCYEPERAPSDEILRREHTGTAGLLREAGADLILVETQNTAREAVIATEAALATGLPVWVSLMPRSGTGLFGGGLLVEAARAVHRMGAEVVLVNCAPPAIIAAAFRTLREALPEARLGAYPNFAHVGGAPWEFTASSTPGQFVEWTRPILNQAAVLGGCCGSTPEHIAALSQALQSQS